MGIGKVHSWKKLIAQLLLLALPTAVFFFYLVWDLNHFYSILQNDWLSQGAYFTSGLVIALVFYSYRFRFITTVAIVCIIFYSIYKFLGSLTVGEFDAFYFSIQFLIFSILFATGWLFGYGFSRSNYFTIAWSVLLLSLQIVVVSKTTEINVNVLVQAFAPVLAYAFYIIYTSELIRNMNEDESFFSWFIIKRLFGFGLILLVLFLLVFTVFYNDFKVIEKEWGGAQANYNKEKGESESMNQKDKNGNVSNKDQTRLTGSLNKDKQLTFVAKLDNYFGDGSTPNPLYFTYCYYTKFDTATQTFETDKEIPYNDLFAPDPSKIPLYFAKTDSSVIKNTFATSNRKVVSADIYKIALSPTTFLAPSTAFYCQPISVPKEYKDQYKSAYRAKMWVSDLNSAYFIYNPAGNFQLEAFQQQRFNKLREIKKIISPDTKFMNYYTYMPQDSDYKRITQLAKKITVDATTPIDKMISIRDYFLSKDEFGQPLYQYSDNPGIPGIPSANKLNYFLFENKKGYCAYYAGATLFMLRSLGIPSRIAAGYLTVDRSSKNPGWYWFYADQAHAWVQVYFQEYGWIDFDTTIPDVNTQQSSQPDGTPPLNMPQTYLVADGTIENVNVNQKQITMTVEKLQYHDKDYFSSTTKNLLIDVSLATVSADTGTVLLNALKKGIHITAVSSAEVLKKNIASANDNFSSLIDKLSKPVPVDEIKIVMEEEIQKLKKEKDKIAQTPINWLKIAKVILLLIVIFTLLLFLTPWVIWQYLNIKAKQNNNLKAFNSYRAVLYYLNQMGYKKELQGPQQYALSMDQKFGTAFNNYNTIYQKIKYSYCTTTFPVNLPSRKCIFLAHLRVEKQRRSRMLIYWSL